MKRIIAAAVVAASVGLSACGGSSNQSCLVLAEGGNKVCDATAAAWCRATDSLRALTPNVAEVKQTQQDCDGLEATYPQ